MTPTPVGAGSAGLNRSSAPSSFTTASFAHAEGDSCRPEVQAGAIADWAGSLQPRPEPGTGLSLLSGKTRMASRHYRQSARACTAPKGRPVTVISANFGSAAAGPGNSEKCRPGACCGGPARGYRHELRMSDARMPSQIYRKVEIWSPRSPCGRPMLRACHSSTALQ